MSTLPGCAVLECCVYSNKWNMHGNYPGHWCQLYAERKGAILLSKQFAYTPTACVVGMVPGTCSLLSHAWESVIWHRLIGTWTVLFFTKTFAMLDAWEDQWRRWFSSDFTSPGSQVQSFDSETPLKSVTFILWCGQTVSSLDFNFCFKNNFGTQLPKTFKKSAEFRSRSTEPHLQRLLCAFHAQLQPGQCYSSATQDHTCTHPGQGGAHCVDP